MRQSTLIVNGKFPASAMSILERFNMEKQRGDVNRIAKKLNIYPESVSRVLKGEFYNEDVINEAFEILIDRASKWQSKKDRLQALSA